MLRMSKAGSLKTVACSLAHYNFCLVTVQDLRWYEGGSHPEEDYTFFYGNWNAHHHLGTDFFIHKGIISAAKRVEFIGDGMLYIRVH